MAGRKKTKSAEDAPQPASRGGDDDQQGLAQATATTAGAGGGMGLSQLISKPVLVLALLAAMVSLAVDYAPAPIAPREIQFDYAPRTIDQEKRYIANVAPRINSRVFEQAEHVLVNEALAAEDLVVSPDGTRAFVGLKDGRVAYITSDPATGELTLHDFARTGVALATCGTLQSEPQCGRPLGMTFVNASFYAKYVERLPGTPTFFSNTHVLLVADAFKGLLLLDARGEQTLVFDAVGARKVKFLNSMAVGPKGDLYLTDSSRRFARNQVTLDNLERMLTGRLLHFNPRTGTTTVLAKELGFPNGIVLVDEGKALVIALTFQQKLVKYSLVSKTLDDFAYLPGQPDNLWIHPVNHPVEKPHQLFVGLVSIPPTWLKSMMASTKLRKFLAQILPPAWLVEIIGRRGAFVTVDLKTGDVIEAYQDTDGSARLVSGVHAWGDHYYLMSWFRPYIVRIPKTAFV